MTLNGQKLDTNNRENAMFDNAVLAEPAMAIDPVHDGRHALPDKAHARESIPYIVVLPEHGIAFFTYTWVNGNSEAGAALAVFGPGVGGPHIQQRLADRQIGRASCRERV